MVILNKEILVCKLSIQKSIRNIILEVMPEYFDKEILVEKTENKKKVMESIIRNKVNDTKSDNFWYTNSSDKICTFKHKEAIMKDICAVKK
jgi:hypothetical protein